MDCRIPIVCGYNQTIDTAESEVRNQQSIRDRRTRAKGEKLHDDSIL